MNRKRKAIAAAAATALAVTVLCTASSCDGSSTNGNTRESNAQQADTNSLEASQPIPHFNYSQIRQTIIDAETVSANGTQTTSFFFQMGNQDPVFSCPSIGMPVANTAQLSNPQQPYTGPVSTGQSDIAVGQMDPDGVYAPSASSGTYVICVNGSGAKYLDYWEGDVFTVAGAAEWDTATHSMKVIGAPTAAVHTAPTGSEAAPKSAAK